MRLCNKVRPFHLFFFSSLKVLCSVVVASVLAVGFLMLLDGGSRKFPTKATYNHIIYCCKFNKFY